MKFKSRGLISSQVLLLGISLATMYSAFADILPHDDLMAQLRSLESTSATHIGVYAMNSANNQKLEFNAEKRFPFCSTAKFITVAAILKNSESNPDYLQQQIKFTHYDVQTSGYSPITANHVTNGMTIAELSFAALAYSDNTAMNLLIASLGGIAQVNNYARTLNDSTFRLDRPEPRLNTAIPHDLRDTATPQAMGRDIQQLLLGNALNATSRDKLAKWMIANTTGAKRIRAGVPQGWVVAEKTGSGDYGTANDIGVIYPNKCKPLVMSIYTTSDKKEAKYQDEVVAKVTKLVLQELAKTDQCLKNSL